MNYFIPWSERGRVRCTDPYMFGVEEGFLQCEVYRGQVSSKGHRVYARDLLFYESSMDTLSLMVTGERNFPLIRRNEKRSTAASRVKHGHLRSVNSESGKEFRSLRVGVVGSQWFSNIEWNQTLKDLSD